MSQQIYTDGSFTQNGFKGEYYNTRNLTGELFQAAIEPAIDHAWKYGAPFDGMPVDQFSAVGREFTRLTRMELSSSSWLAMTDTVCL